MNLQQQLEELKQIENPTEEQLSQIAEIEKQIAEEELQKKIQSEADKVRGKYAKELKEMKEKLEALQTEKMTDEEKLAKEKAEKESALAEREAQLLAKELDFETMSILAEKKLDKTFLPFLTGKTIEDRKEQLGVLEAHINSKIQDAIKTKLGQNPSPSCGQNGGLQLSKSDFDKMGYAEKSDLFLKNPELYNQLKNL